MSPCVLRGRGHWARGVHERGTGQDPVLQNSGAQATVSSPGMRPGTLRLSRPGPSRMQLVFQCEDGKSTSGFPAFAGNGRTARSNARGARRHQRVAGGGTVSVAGGPARHAGPGSPVSALPSTELRARRAKALHVPAGRKGNAAAGWRPCGGATGVARSSGAAAPALTGQRQDTRQRCFCPQPHTLRTPQAHDRPHAGPGRRPPSLGSEPPAVRACVSFRTSVLYFRDFFTRKTRST